MNRRITGLFLIVVPLAFNIAFFTLGSSFNYPDILREPAADILNQFAAGGSGLITLWYLFAMTALLAIPLALLVSGVLHDEYPQLAQAAAIIGALSGLVQVLGLLRWVFLVPGLAATYTTSADPAARETAVIVFEAAHQYLGVAVGEHLGYLFTGSWTIVVSVMMLRSRFFPRWLAFPGILAAVGILIGLLEPAGVSAAGAVNAISYIVWSLWLIAAGLRLIFSPQTSN